MWRCSWLKFDDTVRSVSFNFTPPIMPGWKQRAAAEDGPAPASLPGTRAGSSFLSAVLIEMWAFGFMSPQVLQRIAEASLRDVEAAKASPTRMKAVIKDLKALADIGDGGAYQGNCNRDLLRQLAPSRLYNLNFRMPLRILGSALNSPAFFFKQSMLLPHVLFSVMGNHYPAAFAKLMCPSRQRLQEFWGNMARNPQLLSTMGWMN